jgi:hypothetical protein
MAQDLVPGDSVPGKTLRWSIETVLALAPDQAAQRAGSGLGTPAPWRGTGFREDPFSIWGLCQGGATLPYQTCVDLTEPAYRCSCPSRKSPCKHALGLMLLWSSGGVPDGKPPAWVKEWFASRSGRKESGRRQQTAADPATTEASRARRAKRVEAGVAELERWLTDQVRQGLAGASRAGYGHWDSMAARLVDAQAPGLAAAVRRLASVATDPDRLLAELALIWLLVRAYRRLDELPAELAATVRSRIGFPVATDEVLAGPRIHDEWDVVGVRDEADGRLTVRRVWLRGVQTGRAALVLSFAPAGQPLASDLMPGTRSEADLCFYPGALPLRALLAHRYDEPRPGPEPSGAVNLGEALDEYAASVAAEPWLERWPMVLHEVVPVPVRSGLWQVADRAGAAVALNVFDSKVGWRLVAAAGGRPCTLGGEWSATGLRPLAAWVDGRLVQP